MANRSRPSDDVGRLKDENRRLKDENERLNALLSGGESRHAVRHKGSVIHRTGVVAFSILAVLLLFLGNLFFWAGNTIVKTDRYVASVEPLIRQPEVQNAVSSYATQQLFQSVDVEQLAEEALPPRAAFLAPTLSSQVQDNAQKVIAGVLKNPKFQDKWNNAQAHAHDRFIAAAEKHGSDGTIDLSEVYGQITPELKDTKLAFLADKPLPAKVGSIKLVEGSWLSKLETLIANIDTWRTIAIFLLLIFSILAVWLSRNRRKIVITLGISFAATMFLTLIAIRLSRELVSGKVDAQYADAARVATQTILHPLAVQTATILVLGLLVAFVAWISGPYRSARRVNELIQGLFAGKLHSALFKQENGFTLWMGRNKAWLQWGAVVIVSLVLLIVRLTPKALAIAALIILLLILIIEALAAGQTRRLSSP